MVTYYYLLVLVSSTNNEYLTCMNLLTLCICVFLVDLIEFYVFLELLIGVLTLIGHAF